VAPKPRPDIDDAQWAARRRTSKHKAAGARHCRHGAQKTDVAIKEYELPFHGRTGGPGRPRPARRRLQYGRQARTKQSRCWTKALADAQLNPAIRNAATSEKMKAAKAKETKNGIWTRALRGPIDMEEALAALQEKLGYEFRSGNCCCAR
jgi:hypothetical protein